MRRVIPVVLQLDSVKNPPVVIALLGKRVTLQLVNVLVENVLRVKRVTLQLVNVLVENVLRVRFVIPLASVLTNQKLAPMEKILMLTGSAAMGCVLMAQRLIA